PQLYSRDYLEQKRVELGEHAFAAQYLMSPVPRGGGLFVPGSLRLVDAFPGAGTRVRAYDIAASTGAGSDWTVGTLLRKVGPTFVVDSVVRFRCGPAEVEARIREVAEADGRAVPISLPVDAGGAGKFQAHTLVSALAGWTVHTSRETGSKVARATPVASQARVGNVVVVRGPNVEELLREAEVFPNGRHDDCVDSLSRAFEYLVVREQFDDYVPVAKLFGVDGEVR
ncbi:MAG: phage terminase large subunit, partial [Chloroflexi bacterium]|nr:phage terminase large subunit [Chloroflexota bacterium]